MAGANAALSNTNAREPRASVLPLQLSTACPQHAETHQDRTVNRTSAAVLGGVGVAIPPLMISLLECRFLNSPIMLASCRTVKIRRSASRGGWAIEQFARQSTRDIYHQGKLANLIL